MISSAKVMISEKDFLKLTREGNLIPVYKEILGDLDTPVSAYFKIAEKARYSFLLESVEGQAKVARFSFLARDPELILQTKDQKAVVTRFIRGRAKKDTYTVDSNPLRFIRDILKPYRFVSVEGLPRFCGGLVGYMSYDIVRFFERLPRKTTDDLKLPDMFKMLARDLIIFDHLTHTIKIVSCAYIKDGASQADKRRAYQHAVKQIEQLQKDIHRPLTRKHHRPRGASNMPLQVTSNFTAPEFERIVREAKKKIRAGEIIQVVLSQRFSVDLKTDPFNIYRTLRGLNPSPYMYYLNFDKIKIIGASPELLVRCEDGVVETRPIAGTRPRGTDEKQDAALARDLLEDPKEKAEHIMLVDLGRNDLGRVCRKGTVRLSEFMNIEKYSHVMHIVSNVKGRLETGKDHLDVLQAAFPAGTVSGAPKIRAMEIIEELERQTRGPYAGGIGYFSFSGNMDSCITIRTIVVVKNRAYVQAGAGIVADSRPNKEFQETQNKARAQIKAIELAHHHF